MATRHTFTKYESETMTFAIDWTNYLADANNGSADTISSAAWTVETGITKVADSVSGNRTLIQVSGGTANVKYSCMCQLTLTSGSDSPIRHVDVLIESDPV